MSQVRVVIADDEAIIRMDLVETLSAAGYDVVGQAGDGQRALEVVAETKPDIVVLDIKMPLLDGIEAARTLRHKVPVVLLTAFGQADMIAQANDAGVMAYVLKPFSEGEVVAALEIARMRFQEFADVVTDRDATAELLENRKVLDRAKGLLQQKLSITEPEAFRWIQKAAMDRRLSVKEVAHSVVTELGGT